MSNAFEDIKISVIIPIYQVEDYIYRALQSCREQKLKGLEFICVDDESPDKSGEIAEEFAAIDSRFKVIHKKNGGLSSARNAGLGLACGQYIMFLDSDDYLCLGACEKVWETAQKTQADIICFGAYTTPAVPEAEEWCRASLNPQDKFYDKFEPDIVFNTVGAMPFVWRQAFRRELLVKTGLCFDENIKFGEDAVFELELFPQAERFAFMSDHLYSYRWLRKGSLMNRATEDSDRRLSANIIIAEHVCEYWQLKTKGSLTLIECYGGQLLSWILNFIVADCLRCNLNRLEEHKAALRSIFQRYNLEAYYGKLSMYEKKLWKMVAESNKKIKHKIVLD